MNPREFCDHFSIPYRTVADWEAGKRKMPEYLLKLMEYKARIEKLVDSSRTGPTATEEITIQVRKGVSKYLVVKNPEAEPVRNALLFCPFILNQTISHGRAAEILGIRKSKLIDLYDRLSYSYLDMTMDDLDEELQTYGELKKKEAAF